MKVTIIANSSSISTHLPISRAKLAGILSHIGIYDTDESSLLCFRKNPMDIKVILVPSNSSEVVIADLCRKNNISLEEICKVYDYLESLSYEHTLSLMKEVEKENPKTYSDFKRLLYMNISYDETARFYFPVFISSSEVSECSFSDSKTALYIKDKLKEVDYDTGIDISDNFRGNNRVLSKLKSIYREYIDYEGNVYGCVTVNTTEPLNKDEEASIKAFVTLQNQSSPGSPKSFSVRIRGANYSICLFSDRETYFVDNEYEFRARMRKYEKNAGDE